MASIEKTSEDYLTTAISRVRELGSRITDFNDGSVAKTFLESNASMLAQQSQLAEQLRLDSYLATATGDALDAKALDYQVPRKAAVAATGTVTISRAAAGAGVVIPAGWGELQTLPAPGAPSVAFVTTADATFAPADTSKTVAAVAVLGGTQGNIAAGTVLLPVNPVAGFQTQGGFAAAGNFANGVDVESDDALRARVPVEVQGRVKGLLPSYLAAALRVPGVTSANVLRAGDTRENATVLGGGEIEVYYEGAAGLLTSVTIEVLTAATALQDPSTFVATARPVTIGLTVYVTAGIDTAAVASMVTDNLLELVNGCGVSVLARQSAGIQVVHAVPEVLSMSVPFTDFRLSSATVGTHADINPGVQSYLTLAAVDVTVAVVEI